MDFVYTPSTIFQGSDCATYELINIELISLKY